MERQSKRIAGLFFPPAAIKEVQPYGTGKVNDTFLVMLSGKRQRFLLQRLSPAVFARPQWIMENLRLVCDHIQARLTEGPEQSWQMVRICRTREGNDFVLDRDGSCWRMLHFIEESISLDTVQTPFQAQQAGVALGRFHQLISDLDPHLLHDTLPGFHVTPLYLKKYDEVAASMKPGSGDDIRFCHDFINRRRQMSHVLEEAAKKGELSLRPIHGDPKISNILFDRDSGQAKSLIDLDTVKPGLIHYDIGDCLRSCCNRAGEESPLSEVSFDMELCRAILQGYLAEAKVFLRPVDSRYIPVSVRLIAFELGLRFFTDYLQGNIYFKTSEPEQNLQRSLVQFTLCASIEAKEQEIERLVAEICG